MYNNNIILINTKPEKSGPKEEWSILLKIFKKSAENKHVLFNKIHVNVLTYLNMQVSSWDVGKYEICGIFREIWNAISILISHSSIW